MRFLRGKTGWPISGRSAVRERHKRSPELADVICVMIETLQRWKWWMFALIALGAWVTYLQWDRSAREHQFDDLIRQAAMRYQIDPALVKAVIWRESRFVPGAQGGKGEIGLMQIGELAAREWAEAEKLSAFQHRQLFDPVMNAHAGAWYLSKMMRRYANTDAPACYALADYNAGRTQVLRWNQGAARTNSTLFLEHIDYPLTRNYVQSILRRALLYQRQFQPAPPSP